MLVYGSIVTLMMMNALIALMGDAQSEIMEQKISQT